MTVGWGGRNSKRHVKCRAAGRVVCQSVTDVSHSECVCVTVQRVYGACVCVSCVRACVSVCESVPACALAHMRVSLSICVSAADSDRVRGVSSYLLLCSSWPRMSDDILGTRYTMLLII